MTEKQVVIDLNNKFFSTSLSLSLSLKEAHHYDSSRQPSLLCSRQTGGGQLLLNLTHTCILLAYGTQYLTDKRVLAKEEQRFFMQLFYILAIIHSALAHPNAQPRFIWMAEAGVLHTHRPPRCPAAYSPTILSLAAVGHCKNRISSLTSYRRSSLRGKKKLGFPLRQVRLIIFDPLYALNITCMNHSFISN